MREALTYLARQDVVESRHVDRGEEEIKAAALGPKSRARASQVSVFVYAVHLRSVV